MYMLTSPSSFFSSQHVLIKDAHNSGLSPSSSLISSLPTCLVSGLSSSSSLLSSLPTCLVLGLSPSSSSLPTCLILGLSSSSSLLSSLPTCLVLGLSSSSSLSLFSAHLPHLSGLSFTFFLFLTLILLCPPAVSAKDKESNYALDLGTTYVLTSPSSFFSSQHVLVRDAYNPPRLGLVHKDAVMTMTATAMPARGLTHRRLCPE
jgi:hypothetical protein